MAEVPEMKHCTKHGDYPVRLIDAGKTHETTGERLVIRMAHCGKCAQAEADQKAANDAQTEALERQARIEKRFAQSGIPKGFSDRAFSNYATELPGQRVALSKATAFASEFPAHMKRGTNLMLIGGIGTGKTHIAISIADGVMSRGFSCMYETAFDLVCRMRDCMRKDAPTSTTAMLDTYGAIDLLILDEIGVQGSTDDVKAHLTNVLDRRYRNGLPTIIISNLDRVALADYVGDRVADRLRERASVVFFDWQSQRGARRQQLGDF